MLKHQAFRTFQTATQETLKAPVVPKLSLDSLKGS
jgi:hypothetical protein